ncbi:MAG: LbFV-ORF102-like protein [Cotesia congregata filamentous virus 2]
MNTTNNNTTFIQCPLNTHFFHSSAQGCSLFLDNNTYDLWHRYHGTLVSSLVSGKALILALMIDSKKNKYMDFTYRITYPLNSNQAVMETGPLNKYIIEQMTMTINNNMKQYYSLDNFLEVIDIMNLLNYCIKEYIMQCTYASDLFGKSIYLNVKNFFDVIIIVDNKIGKNKLCWLRPCFWTENIIEVSKDFLTAILKLFEIKTNTKYNNNNNHNNNSILKRKRLNVSQCNMKTFLNRLPQHLKCSKTTNTSMGGGIITADNNTSENTRFYKCQHFNLCDVDLESIEEHTIVNMSLPSKFYKNTCSNILRFLQNKFSIEVITKIYGYSCRLNKQIKNEIDKEYNRMELLHPIVCCPDTLINNMYLLSLFDLFLTKKSSMDKYDNSNDLWKKQLYSLLYNNFNKR